MRKQIKNQDIFELAAAIVSSAANLNTFLKGRTSQNLSFANPAPVLATSPENSAYYEARARCIEAAERLVEFVRGPRDMLVELSFQVRLFHPLIRSGTRWAAKLMWARPALRISFLAADSAIQHPPPHTTRDCNHVRQGR